MDFNQEIKLRGDGGGGAAVKDGCRIIATTFLSLLLPLSFLLLARLSTARYYLSITSDKTIQPQFFSLLTSLFNYTNTTLILTLLVSLVTILALTHCLTGTKPAYLISERRRFYASWILLFFMNVCLSLGIQGTIDAEINSYTEGKLILPRRLLFAFGLHETMIFWWGNVVRPVVDETILGFRGEGFMSWTEKVVLAVAFGNLWWRRLKEEAEALVVVPWVMTELRMGVGVTGVLGWWLYYFTVAIGAVRLVKGVLWVVVWIFRYRPVRKKTTIDEDDSV